MHARKALAVLAALIGLQACVALSGLDDFERVEGPRPGDGGAAGAGGQGGGSTSTTTGGSGGGEGGQGGFGGSMLSNGTPCVSGAQCVSTFCVDGVCCEAACDGTCVACNVAGSEGTCTNAEAGTDPHDTCSDDGAATCGMDGNCDGNGACSRYPSGTTCVDASCANGTANTVDTCDGAGNCIDGLQASCAPYQCDSLGLTCLTSCADSTGCVDTFFCNMQGNCVPDEANGQSCQGNDQCTSGFCVDGVCCDTGCGGTCLACNVAGLEGTCSPTPLGSTELGCMGNNACNGAGACAAANGQPCAGGGECVSGHCADGVCCNTACAGACQACNNAGTEGTCGNLPQGTVDPVCADPNNTTCNASGQCKLPNGAPCGAPADCASGNCTGSPIATCQP